MHKTLRKLTLRRRLINIEKLSRRFTKENSSKFYLACK